MSIHLVKLANGVLEDPEDACAECQSDSESRTTCEHECQPHCCSSSRCESQTSLVTLQKPRAWMACPGLFRSLSSTLSKALCLAQKLQQTQRYPMATLNQMHRHGRPKWPEASPSPMNSCPQLKGVVLKTMIRKPKKPNSANRKCCRVRLSTGREAVCFIPGEGHSLQEHHVVLVQGGRTQDLPGIKLKVVRGKYDCGHVQKKK